MTELGWEDDQVSEFIKKHNELKPVAEEEVAEVEEKVETADQKGGKKKVRCNCKKKCKGPCKRVKN